MKKFITSFAIAASMLCGTASAQVPTTYNYQGVSSVQNQPIKVEFAIMDGDNVVYREEQTVQTNKDGLFTTKVGGNADGWDEIDWTAGKYELHVKAQGHEATCELNAVPYATVAQSYVGQDIIESDLQELVTANMNRKTETEDNKAEIAKINNWLENVDMIATPTYKQVFGWEGETEEENVVGLVEKVANLEMVTDDIAGIQETLRGKANVDEVAAIENLAQSLSEDLYKEDGIVDTVIANQEAIAALDDQLNNKEDGIAKNLVAVTEQANKNFNVITALTNKVNNSIRDTAEDFTKVNEILDNVTDDVQGIQETLRGKANVDDVAEVKADLEATTNLAQSVSEDLYKEGGIVDHVVALDDLNLPNVVENLEGLVPVVETLVEDVDGLKGAVELLYSEEDGPIASLTQGFTQLSNVVSDNGAAIEKNAADIFTVSDDVQGIQETLRGKADVTDVVDLRGTVEANKELLDKTVTAVNYNNTQMQVFGTDVAGIKLDINNLNAAKADKTEVAEVVEGLQTTQQDVMDLTQDNMSNKAAIADVTLTANTALEQVNFLGTFVTDEENPESVINQLETLNNGLAETQQDVLGLVEDNMANKAAIADLQGLDLPNVLENLEGLVPVVEDLVENKIDKAEYDNIVENLEGLVPFVNTLGEDVETLKGAAFDSASTVEALATEVNNLKVMLEGLKLDMIKLTQRVNLLHGAE